MKRTKRKITTLLMSLVLVLSLVAPMLPAMSMKVYAAAEDWSTDQNFETDVTVDGGVIIRRNITLTIAEGVTVTVNGGIDTVSTVTIKGKGQLIVNGSKGNDGVDLDYWDPGDDPNKEAGNGRTGGTGFTGNIVVDGASVTITGGQGGKGGDSFQGGHIAGQGGAGGFGVYGNITVNNGALTVTGGSGGKGGTGDYQEMISGAGGEGGCGINGIVRANGGSIDINGGKGGTGGKGVCDYTLSGAYGNPGADGGNGGSGIRGSVYANGGMITVHGGEGGVGGQGSSGNDGDDFHHEGGSGRSGGKGGNGGEGVSGAITVNGGEIATYGGEGGTGGAGGDGGYSIGDNQGGAGGDGGNGGQGGIGASQDVVVDSGSLTSSGGPGGEGGYGGLGGTGNVKGFLGGGGTDGTYGKAVGGSISGELSEESVDNSTWTEITGSASTAQYVSVTGSEIYSVVFDENGKTATDMPAALTVKEGEKATAPDKTPKADGFIFGGWYTSADCKDEEAYDFTKAVTGDVTLYAKWTCVEHTVTFDANGQTATDMPEAQKVENGKTATTPDKEPASEGFKFAGWYTSKECKDEEAYDFTKAVTGDITLYAKWVDATAETYTVTFDLNGVSGNAPEAQTVEEGKTVSKPEDPKAEGFLFKTWCSDNAGEKEYDFTAPVSANFTLYAKWEANSAPGPVVIGKSSLDPVPELVPGKTKDLYLVKGQKFNIAQGWYIERGDRESKSKVSINSKTGVFKAKSEGEAVIKSGFGDTEWEVKVHISKPKMGKTLKLQLETDTEVKSEQLQFEYDKNLKVLWYSANPDVVTVDNTGKVTTVGKGTSKVTAYINGSAYSCMVKVTEKEPLLNRTLHVAKGSSKSISIKGLKNAEWEDSVKDIVSVQNNKVKGLNAGTTELSVSQNGKAYKVNVIVEDLTMKGTGLRTQGKTGSNKYIIDELKANDKTSLSFEGVTQPVVFKSSKPDVAFIDENLNVVIRGRGSAKFTAKVNGKTVTISVTVK